MNKHPLLGRKVLVKSIPGLVSKRYPLAKNFPVPIIAVGDREHGEIYGIRLQPELFESCHEDWLLRGWKRKDNENCFHTWDENHGPEEYTVYVWSANVEFVD